MGFLELLERNTLSRKGGPDPVAQKIGKGNIIDMLQLTSATCTEVWTGGGRAVRTWNNCSVVLNTIARRGRRVIAAVVRNPVAAGSKADDPFYRNCLTDR